MRQLPQVREPVSHPGAEDRAHRPHVQGERKLDEGQYPKRIPPGGHGRRAAFQHGQPGTAARLLGPYPHQCLPGDEPAHRPAAGAYGDTGVPWKKAAAAPAEVSAVRPTASRVPRVVSRGLRSPGVRRRLPIRRWCRRPGLRPTACAVSACGRRWTAAFPPEVRRR